MLADLSILVVEDHEFQREMLVELLKRMEAKQVYAAADGQSAIDVLANLRAPVDVIISDIEMPTMDGLEFVRRVGEAGYRSSVVLVSAIDASLLTAAEAMTKAYGITLLGVIGKPITRATLEKILVRHAPAAVEGKRRSATRPKFTVAEIMEGLEQNEFEPFFQPKVDVTTRRVVGAEALARWRHPQQGIVLPESFVKVLEDAGRIDELMWSILGKAVRFCSIINATGVETVIAVNVSLKSLGNMELANRIIEIVQGHGVAAEKMCFEITETAATTNLGAALENLTRLRMKGFGLSIDDFGTGYSSMQQLTRIPLTELKIDQAFVHDAAGNEAANVVLRSSLQVAKELKIKAVAEGVETQQDWDVLQELGCDLAQGFLIAKPMDADSYLTWIKDLASDPTSMFVP
jgi:EAL domain-containing protein (putative c-di-GMP-specific phosphodiesterase class I)/AmiR/NasT family two-component response regulator